VVGGNRENNARAIMNATRDYTGTKNTLVKELYPKHKIFILPATRPYPLYIVNRNQNQTLLTS
jgi:hypothetical protein